MQEELQKDAGHAASSCQLFGVIAADAVPQIYEPGSHCESMRPYVSVASLPET